MQRRLRLHPPAHWLVASAVGYEAPEQVEHMTPEAARSWFAATGGRIDGVAKMPGA